MSYNTTYKNKWRRIKIDDRELAGRLDKIEQQLNQLIQLTEEEDIEEKKEFNIKKKPIV